VVILTTLMFPFYRIGSSRRKMINLFTYQSLDARTVISCAGGRGDGHRKLYTLRRNNANIMKGLIRPTIFFLSVSITSVRVI